MNDTRELLERVGGRFAFPDEAFERLERRRDRKRRNRRIGAGALAIIVAIVSFVALTRAFRTTESPADEPTPNPQGIFSEVGGWITYGNPDGIWAVDPSHPGDPGSQIQLSTERGTPLAWSNDGSKLLIQSWVRPRSTAPARLYVLNADGTETTLTTGNDWCSEGSSSYCGSGGSLSPDGAQVIYMADGSEGSSIYVVDTQGGTPRVLLTAGRRWFAYTGRRVGTWLSNPTYSPDGTQIAYFDHIADSGAQLRVMNADGSGVHILLHRAGLPPATGYHIYNLAWSPDGERLAWGGNTGIFVVGADGSGLSLVIPHFAENPYWSPDGTRIAYGNGPLEIASADGTHVQRFGRFGYGASGPWNPLVQPEAEVTEAAASERSASVSILRPQHPS